MIPPAIEWVAWEYPAPATHLSLMRIRNRKDTIPIGGGECIRIDLWYVAGALDDEVFHQAVDTRILILCHDIAEYRRSHWCRLEMEEVEKIMFIQFVHLNSNDMGSKQ